VSRTLLTRFAPAYAAGAFGLSFSSMVVFLVQLRASELGSSTAFIGVIVGAGGVVAAFASIPLGGVIDRFGPKLSFAIGTWSCVVAAIGMVASTSPWHLLLWMIPISSGRSMAWVASQSLCSTLDSEEGSGTTHTGRFSFSSNAGLIAAPLLAGVAADVLGFRWAFVVIAAYAGIFGVLSTMLPRVAVPKDAKRGRRGGGSFREAWALLGQRGMRATMLLSLVRLWLTTGFSAFFPLFLVQSGLPPSLVGTVLASKSAVGTASTLGAARLARWRGPETAGTIALSTSAVGMLLTPFAATVPLVYLPPMLLGIGQGLSLPLLIRIVSTYAPSERRGLALGLRATVNQVGTAVAPPVIGALIGVLGVAGGFPIGAAAAGAMLAAAASMFRRVRREADSATQEVSEDATGR